MNEIYNKYYVGIIYNPYKKDTSINAIVYIDDKGIATISSINGLWDNEYKPMDNISMGYGFIHNVEDNNKTYTIQLLDIIQISQNFSPLTKYRYRSNEILIAEGIDKNVWKNTCYNTLLLTSKSFSRWVKISGLKTKIKDLTNFDIAQNYIKPETIDIFDNKEKSIQIFFRAQASAAYNREVYIKEQVFLLVKIKNLADKNETLSIRAKIDRLLILILDTPLISDMEMRNENGFYYKYLKPNHFYNERDIVSPIDFEYFLNNSQIIFEKWFEKQKILDLFIRRFFGVFGRYGIFVEDKFLTYISILENFYKYKYKNKVNLKKQLLTIFTLSSLNEKIKDIDNYVETLKITRNYLTHSEEKHEKKSLSNIGMDKTNRVLEFLIRELLLKELSIENIKGCKYCSYDIIKNQ